MADPDERVGGAAPAVAATSADDAAAVPYARPLDQADQPALNRYDLALVAIRLLAIYSLLQLAPILSYVPGLIYYTAGGRGGRIEFGELLLTISPAAIYLAIGLFLFLRAERLANRLAGGTNSLPPRPGLGVAAREVQAVAFSVVGVLLVLQSVPLIISEIAGLYRGQHADDYNSPAVGAAWGILHPAVQIILGAWLFLGSKSLAAFWHRIRHPELARRHDEDDEEGRTPTR